jgi:aspartate 1-decarboxylase
MLRNLCKSKIHRATITNVHLHYEGSIAVDAKLLKAADILPNEMVQVVNVNNGARFETYAIEAKAGSGTIALNGAAARLGMPGDKIIILSTCYVDTEVIRKYRPKVVCVDDRNRIARRARL